MTELDSNFPHMTGQPQTRKPLIPQTSNLFVARCLLERGLPEEALGGT
jgi:hypothetical protein